jgi:hydroxymethylbilane synthase
MAAVAFLDAAATRFAVTAERAALAALGGGCQVPIGIHCRASAEENGEVSHEVFAVVAVPESGLAVRIYHRAPQAGSDAEALGRLVAKMLIEAGAGPLLEAVAGGSR